MWCASDDGAGVVASATWGCDDAPLAADAAELGTSGDVGAKELAWGGDGGVRGGMRDVAAAARF